MLDKEKLPEAAKILRFKKRTKNKYLVWRMLHPTDHVCHHCIRTNPLDKDCGCKEGYYMEMGVKQKDGEVVSACVRFLFEGNYVK